MAVTIEAIDLEVDEDQDEVIPPNNAKWVNMNFYFVHGNRLVTGFSYY